MRLLNALPATNSQPKARTAGLTAVGRSARPRLRLRVKRGRIDGLLAKTPGVADWITIGGLSLLDFSSAPNAGTLFITLEPWEERLAAGHSLDAIMDNLRKQFGQIQEGIVFAFAPSAIRGLGVRGGFQMQVEDRADVGLLELQQVTQAIMEDARSQTALAAMNTMFRPGVPQLYVDVDRVKVKTLDIPLSTVFATLQAYLGSAYVNDFNKFGRIYQVRAQAESQFRADPCPAAWVLTGPAWHSRKRRSAARP